jgi:hypothetical protein
MATLGKILFWGSGIILYLLSIYSYYLWFGGLGALAALIVPPLAELFPFVYLFLVGFTPEFLLIIIIWLVGLVGVFMNAAANKEKPSE